MTIVTTDVVVPVFNSLHHVRFCLRSLRAHTPEPFRLIVIDDGSDTYVAEQVTELLKTLWRDGDPEPVLLRNEENLGFLRSVNRGISHGNSDYVVLLNSDTVVGPGWLSGLREALELSPQAGIACPVSNHANLTRIDIPDGTTFLEQTEWVRRESPVSLPRIGLASGFCFIARRSVYNRLGLFDPIYGRGYFEESDFCMRAQERGWQVIGDDHTFVFHHGWGSFEESGRNEWMERNRELFQQRWGRAHEYFTERFLDEKPFAELEQRISRKALQQRATSRPHRLRSLRAFRLARAAADDPSVPTFALWPAEVWRTIAEAASGPLSPGKPRVLFLLPGLGAYGGVISVVQLVNRLLFAGVDAQIATAGRVDEEIYREAMYFRPYRFSGRKDMLAALPSYDLVVSTRWDTAYDALLLKERWGCRVASFIQDAEARHQRADSPEREAAFESYRLIRHKVAKSRWMVEQLAPYGGTIHQIRLGLNLDIFYPKERARASSATRRIISASRPGVEIRNHEGTLQIMGLLAERREDVLPTFFGRRFDENGFRNEHLGPLSQSQVARLLSGGGVLVDASLEQGFGRPGLEAMACGMPAVLTTIGGINEYAQDGINCLQVEPTDVKGYVAAVERLLDDEHLAARLRRGGLETARSFDAELEAERWRELIVGLLEA